MHSMDTSNSKDPAFAAESRVLVLEEEVRNLKEELRQCQVDKEFVWSLWKRLQVANPDITQAVSLVVESPGRSPLMFEGYVVDHLRALSSTREKQKAELKDRKVLEILQVKDSKIQALEQDTKECAVRKEEQSRLVIKNLEEENEGLSTRYADLLNDLEKLRKQEAQWRIEKSGIDAKIKNFEADLTDARVQMEIFHSRCNDLATQLRIKQTELTQKDLDVARARKELQELQNLYKQNTEHAAQQAELIQQLQALNMDTQKVLKTQEDAHTAETISYQKLHNELTICFDKLKASEIQLRQSQISLQNEVFEKEQRINQLESQLQQALSSASTLPQETYPKKRKEGFHQYSSRELEYLIATQKSEIKLLQEKLKRANCKLADRTLCSRDFLDCISVRTGKKYKEPPVKRSRSLSPKSFLKESEELRKLQIAEKKIENLEKSLQLKTQENDELRQAHEKRKKRLQMFQTNYRAVKKQLKQWEEGNSKTGSRNSGKKRADPRQLCQEDSDAVWNELAYFKKEHKKLLSEKLDLEEELDQMKVCVSRDKAKIQELNLCLQQEREDLLFRLGEEDEVTSSTPKKNVKEISAQTLQKVCQLERRLKAFEKESRQLIEVNKGLMKDNNDLKATLQQHREGADTREREVEKLLQKIKEIKQDKAELQLMIDGLEGEVTSLKRQVAETNTLRNENKDLLSQVRQLQTSLDKARMMGTLATVEATCGPCRCKSASSKVMWKTEKKKSSVKRHQSFLNQSIKVMSGVFENFSKDGWEDMSESSDSEIPISESQGTIISKTRQQIPMTGKKNEQEQNKMEENEMPPCTVHLEDTSKPRHIKDKEVELAPLKRKKTLNFVLTSKVNREKRRNVVLQKVGCSSSLRARITSLQQQLTVLQNSKRTTIFALQKSKEENAKLTSQLRLTEQRLQASKQTVQTLMSNLTELQREKSDLQGKLDHLTQSTKLREGLSSVISGHTVTTSASPLKNAELEMKQLQYKLKNANNEITKQSSTIKSLKNEVQSKEEQMRELQEKISRMERDLSMKRRLIEDWKTQMKSNQEKEKTLKETLQTLEEKVKTLTEECSNKKASIDSLKQRLNVTTKGKAQYEQLYRKATEEMQKKELKVTNLEGKMAEAEFAMSELETTASQQLHGLARQSGQALEVVQKKLMMANEKVEEFVTFVKTLATELQRNVKEIRTRIRHTKKIQQEKKYDSGISKESVHRAQYLAASILNISKTDLDDILDVEDDEVTEQIKREHENDKEWMSYLQKLLEGQFPFASYLMDAMLEKLNEQKKLAEEYSSLVKQMM
ncbi:centlein isoform X3 [Sphaerodactylus townsendi]|uniref:centlein isoform X3 n=1 Tax=Sphaerodactylus townsendi TaxID=933632 RepID=UPI002026C9A4|nr:centlein isoform X3 [Sphaerodactylus townsendi]